MSLVPGLSEIIINPGLQAASLFVIRFNRLSRRFTQNGAFLNTVKVASVSDIPRDFNLS